MTERIGTQKGSKETSSSNGVSRKVSLFHKNLKYLSGATLDKLKEMDVNQLRHIDAIKWLEEIAMDNELDVTHVNIEEKSKSNKFQSLIQLSTVPVTVCFGTGITDEEAKKEAAINALKHIKLLSK